MFVSALDSLGNVSSPCTLHQVNTSGSSVWNEYAERARHYVGCWLIGIQCWYPVRGIQQSHLGTGKQWSRSWTWQEVTNECLVETEGSTPDNGQLWGGNTPKWVTRDCHNIYLWSNIKHFTENIAPLYLSYFVFCIWAIYLEMRALLSYTLCLRWVVGQRIGNWQTTSQRACGRQGPAPCCPQTWMASVHI